MCACVCASAWYCSEEWLDKPCCKLSRLRLFLLMMKLNQSFLSRSFMFVISTLIRPSLPAFWVMPLIDLILCIMLTIRCFCCRLPLLLLFVLSFSIFLLFVQRRAFLYSSQVVLIYGFLIEDGVRRWALFTVQLWSGWVFVFLLFMVYYCAFLFVHSFLQSLYYTGFPFITAVVSFYDM